MIRSYFIMRLLGPAVTGVWMGLQLVLSYGANAHLGAIFGMHRHVPLLRGRGDPSGAEQVKRTTFTFTLITGALSFLVVAAAPFGLLAPLEPLVGERVAEMLAHLREPEVRPVVLALAAVLPANLLKGFYVTLFKAENRFREASVASLWGSVAGVATLALLPPFGLPGVVWGLLVLIGVETLHLALRAGPIGFGLRWSVLREQLAVGALTVAIQVVAVLFGSIDRTVLLERFSAEPRGYYTPALLASTFFAGLAAVPNAILFPRLSERFGRTGRPADLLSLVDVPLRVVAAGFAFVAGAGMLATPALLRLALPKYVPGTAAVQIALWGFACFMMVGVVVNVFYAVNRQWLYLGMVGVSAAVSYGLTLAALRAWPGLEAVAAGTSCGYLAFLVAVVLTGWLVMEQPAGNGVRMLRRALEPLAWAGACACGIAWFLPRVLPLDTIAGAVAGELLFLGAFSPWLLWAARTARRWTRSAT